jgi:hypothetical protein
MVAAALSRLMDANRWVKAFEINLEHRREPDWSDRCDLPAETKRDLGRSLSHFQLGESGGGTFLLRGANARAATAGDPAYPRALELFIAEENEHARLLSRLCERYGATLITEHWTHFFFHHVRQIGGIDFELIVLVAAELIGNAYYETLLAHMHDEPLRQAARLILRDEALHCEFHLDRLTDVLAKRGRLSRQFFAISFKILFQAALAVAWNDHARGVRAAGGSRAEFSERAHDWLHHFLSGLGLVAVEVPS